MLAHGNSRSSYHGLVPALIGSRGKVVHPCQGILLDTLMALTQDVLAASFAAGPRVHSIQSQQGRGAFQEEVDGEQTNPCGCH